MAALLLVGAILFALEVTAVTPLTASTSSQHIENQQTEIASGLLDAAAENGSLREAALYWNTSSGQFADSTDDEGYYASGGPPTTFGSMINRTLRDRGVAFNVNVWYVTSNGDLRRERMVNFGTPSDHAVSAVRLLTLYDDDRITGPNEGQLSGTTTFYASDVAPNSAVYNVVRLEVVVWRM